MKFESLPLSDCPQAVRQAIARLHVNLGHPTKADLVRTLCSHGSARPASLAAIHALRCGTCSRTQPVPRHRPSKMGEQFLGQFGERVLLDILYVNLLDGASYQTIAKLEELTIGALKLRVHRLRLLLRASLRSDFAHGCRRPSTLR